MLRDVVYPVKHQKDHEELRYSLRSLSNFAHGRVFLSGDIPKWTKNIIEIPRPKDGINGHQNAFMNLREALDHPELSEEIVVMNDDMFFLRPITEIPIYRGREVGFATWKAASVVTMQVMKKLGTWSGFSYEQHVPFVCEKSKLINILDSTREISDKYERAFWRTIYGNHYRIKGEMIDDVKVRVNPRLKENQIFVSSEDTTFEKHIGAYLKELFPEKSIYEK